MCSVLIAAGSAQYLGYPYALGAPLTYTPHVIKPVVKEVEVPVEYNTYAVKETGCTNVFGFAVPCLLRARLDVRGLLMRRLQRPPLPLS